MLRNEKISQDWIDISKTALILVSMLLLTRGGWVALMLIISIIMAARLGGN